MKKIMIFAFLFSVSSLLSAQNNTVNEELSNLKKQVSSLNSKNASLEKKMKEIKQSSKSTQDSLIARVNENNLRLKALQDSLMSKESEISATKSRTDLIFHSLKLRKTVLYIVAPLVLILVVLLYWQLSKKIQTASGKNETLALNIKKSLEDDVRNARKDSQTEIASVKEALEQKIAGLKK